jgi:hypothetical protein
MGDKEMHVPVDAGFLVFPIDVWVEDANEEWKDTSDDKCPLIDRKIFSKNKRKKKWNEKE